jgi:putative long chain acyl-CoA synthase
MIPGPKSLLGSAATVVRRAEATARNGAEWLAYGGLQTDEAYSPYKVMASHPMYKLRRYFPDDVPKDVPPIVLVPPVMMTAEVWDTSERTSAVTALHKLGVDAWVLDYGRPENEPGGSKRTLTDHVVALDDVVDKVRWITGRDVVLSGYSQGGMVCYQTAAYRRGEGVDSVVAIGASVDTRAPLPMPVTPESFARLMELLLDTGLLQSGLAPPWLTDIAFKLLDPVKVMRGKIAFLKRLHDREALLPGERQRIFLEGEGRSAYPSPAYAELLEQFIVHNRMLEGGFVIGDRAVTLADIDGPILIFAGEDDAIAHPDSVRAISRAAPRADVYEVTHHCGHFGLVGGGNANRRTWPNMAAWVLWRAGQGELPEPIVPAEQVQSTVVPTRSAVAARAETAVEFGLGVARIAYHTGSDAVSVIDAVAREGKQILRLNRLAALQPETVISLGKLLDEAADRKPDDVVLLFGDRAIRQRELKHRVDSVVAGLISVGVRPGDNVGVLMSSRPSAFSLVAAISRLGATAVLLRPEGDLDLEARLGKISSLISDPEHAASAMPIAGVSWCVLGGGSEPRVLPAHLIDMERIDPAKVLTPDWWHRPNPRRAADAAFVLFTGEGDHTKAMVITNRRWALSALGTATAAGLKRGDTVYSVTPLHHSSALLMAVGGAVAAGARFALASGTDRETFWDEVRRYGATHVSYTWTSLRVIANGPEHPKERSHPIRLFIGSGMPRNVWNRVLERFSPATVLEFYASAAGDEILANVEGVKVGSMGRPLPGTPEVKVAAYDVEQRRLVTGPDGMGRECDVDEMGLLLARRAPGTSALDAARSLFARNDAWKSTGDLFTRDKDGDFWLVDPVESLIRTKHGWVPPSRVRNALGTIASVDLAVSYGVPDGDYEIVVAAVTVLAGSALEKADLEAAMRLLEPALRPQCLQVLADIPVTMWSRPLWRPLQRAGLPRPGKAEAVWRLGADGEAYELVGAAGARSSTSKRRSARGPQDGAAVGARAHD